MTQSIKRFRIGTFSPTLIAGAFAALMVACLIAFPLGASAKLTASGTTIGQTVDESKLPGTTISSREELLSGDLIAFDWSEPTVTHYDVAYVDTSTGTYDTSQGMLGYETAFYRDDGAIDHGTGKTMLIPGSTAFYDSGGSGIGDSPHGLQATTFAKLRALEPDTPTAAPTS